LYSHAYITAAPLKTVQVISSRLRTFVKLSQTALNTTRNKIWPRQSFRSTYSVFPTRRNVRLTPFGAGPGPSFQPSCLPATNGSTLRHKRTSKSMKIGSTSGSRRLAARTAVPWGYPYLFQSLTHVARQCCVQPFRHLISHHGAEMIWRIHYFQKSSVATFTNNYKRNNSTEST